MADFTNPGAVASLQSFLSPNQRSGYDLLSSRFPQTFLGGAAMSPQTLQAYLPQQGPTQSGDPTQTNAPLSQNFGQQMMNNYAAQQMAGNKNYGLSDATGDSAGQYMDGAKNALSCCGS